jgi:hypothetical protein
LVIPGYKKAWRRLGKSWLVEKACSPAEYAWRQHEHLSPEGIWSLMFPRSV